MAISRFPILIGKAGQQPSKGSEQRRAPFTAKSGDLLTQYLSDDGNDNNGCVNIWNLELRSIQCMLGGLSRKTGIGFSTHAFRRSVACNLHRKRLSTLDIMYLGGWQDLSMVLRYTGNITFDDCLEHYKRVTG